MKNSNKKLSKKFVNISARNHARLWKKVFGSYKATGMVFHHIDMEMKYRDPRRYIQWNPEDLEIMDKREHMSLHKKGWNPSTETRQRMSDAKLGKHHSEETKQKMREARKHYWLIRKAKEILENGLDEE